MRYEPVPTPEGECSPLLPLCSLFLLAVLFFSLTFVGNSHAVEPEFVQRGATTELLSSVDSVNTSTGALALNVPLGPSYTISDALKFQISLYYSSKLWDPVDDGGWYQVPDPDAGIYDIFEVPKMAPSQNFTAGVGWRASFGELIPYPNPRNNAGGTEDQPIYIGADGATHVLYERLHAGIGNGDGNDGVLYSRDGSQIRVRPEGGYRLVELPSGVIQKFEPFEDPLTGPGYRLVRIYDAHGGANPANVNYLAFQYQYDNPSAPTTLQLTITDSHQRQWQLDYEFYYADRWFETLGGLGVYPQNVVYSKLVEVRMPAFDGGTATYTLDYGDPISLKADCGIRWDQIDKPATFDLYDDLPFLRSIQMPEGESWTFEYYPGTEENYTSCSHGALAGAKLPSGGTLEWEYKQERMRGYCVPFENNSPWIESAGNWVTTRTYRDLDGSEMARWQYDYYFSRDHGHDSTSSLTCERSEGGQYDSSTHYMGSEVLVTKIRDPLGDVTLQFLAIDPTPDEARPGGYDQFEYYLPILKPGVDLPDISIGADLLGELEDWGGPEPIRDAGGRYLSSMKFDCTDGTNCTPYRFSYKKFETETNGFVAPSIPPLMRSATDRNRRLVSHRTVDFRPDGSSFAVTVDYTDPDGLGNSRTRTTTEALDESSRTIRRTTTAYNPEYSLVVQGHSPQWTREWPTDQPWIPRTYAYIDRESGPSLANLDVERTEFHFDAETGFLARKRRLTDGRNRSPEDLLTVYSDDGQGDGLVRSVRQAGGDVFTTDGAGLAETDLADLALPERWLERIHTYTCGVAGSTTARNWLGNSLDLESSNIDCNTGLARSTTDVAGAVTSYDYDSRGRLLTVTPPLSGQQKAIYTPTDGSNGPRVTVSTVGTDLWYQIRKDGFGRVLQDRRRQLGDGAVGEMRTAITEFEYGSNGMLHKSYSPRFSGSGSAGFVEQLDYDPDGRALQTRTISASGQVLGTQHLSVEGNHIFTGTWSHAVDRDTGEEATATRITWKDSTGQVVRVDKESGPNGALATTTYDFDAGGRTIRAETRSGNTTQVRSYDYDGRGFLVSETHPESGTTEHWAYNVIGKAGAQSTANGHTYFFYDQLLERLVEVVEDGPKGHRTMAEFFYPRRNVVLQSGPVPWSKGRLFRARRHNYEGAKDRIITETYIYDQEGRVRSLLTNSGNAGLSTRQNFRYDLAGNPVSSDLPFETRPGTWDILRRVDSTFAYGQPREIGTAAFANPRNPSPLAWPSSAARSITYHANGTPAVISADGGTDTLHLDGTGLGRIGSFEVRNNSGVTLWDSGDYRYDSSGNIRAIQGGFFADTSGHSVNLRFGYAYDGVGRLVASAAAGKAQEFDHDAFGNLVAIQGHSARSMAVDLATNRIAANTYDGVGNMTNGPFGQVAYDHLNMPLSRTQGNKTTRYLYGPGNERVAVLRSDGSQSWTLRDASKKVVRTYERPKDTNTWNVKTDFVHLPRGRVTFDYTSEGGFAGRLFHHADHLGSTRLLRYSSGNLASAKSFLPFGEEVLHLGDDDGEIHRFTGHERDDANLDYMHARFYSPTIGRFLSVDPAQDGSNFYTYTGGNPVNLVDPDGLQTGPPSSGKSAATSDCMSCFSAEAFDTGAALFAYVVKEMIAAEQSAMRATARAIEANANKTLSRVAASPAENLVGNRLAQNSHQIQVNAGARAEQALGKATTIRQGVDRLSLGSALLRRAWIGAELVDLGIDMADGMMDEEIWDMTRFNGRDGARPLTLNEYAQCAGVACHTGQTVSEVIEEEYPAPQEHPFKPECGTCHH